MTSSEGFPLYLNPERVVAVTHAFTRYEYPNSGNECLVDIVQARRVLLDTGAEFFVRDTPDLVALGVPLPEQRVGDEVV